MNPNYFSFVVHKIAGVLDVWRLVLMEQCVLDVATFCLLAVTCNGAIRYHSYDSDLVQLYQALPFPFPASL